MIATSPVSVRFATLLRMFYGKLMCLRVLACLLIASVTVGAAAACPLTAPRSSVTDPASLLGEHAGRITQRLAAYQRASGHQLFVVILPSLNADMSVEQCAVSVFQNWKLGRSGVDDGVLLLVAIKERKMRIEVGYGLEGVLTDARSSRILREVMQPLFARGEYAEGIDQGLGAIMTVIRSAGPVPTGAAGSSISDEAMGKFVLGGFVLLFLLGSTTLGVVGLVFFCLPITGLVYYFCQDWRGWLFAGTCIPIWCAVRWLLIRRNVAKHHLAKSQNKMLTWLRCFVAAGLAWPVAERNHKPLASTTASPVASEGFSFSFAGSGDGGGSSGSSSSSDNDSGGKSGGGGASGAW
jgi:uncharacterized protein